MKTLIVLTLSLISSLAQAEVHESKRMREVLPYLTRGAWVVFDIDNTVLEPKQTLGSDQWFEYMVKKLGNVDRAIEIWSEVQKRTEVNSVEASTPNLIQSLQRQGFRVFALTARPLELDATTRHQLLTQGIKFEKIISIGPGKSKGEMLANEVRESGLPSRIIFIDDKEKHVRSVDEVLGQFPVLHHEFRYGAADPKVKGFSEVLAEVELEEFLASGNLISDEEARVRCNCGAQ